MSSIKISVKGAETLALDEFEPFQGDLKSLSRDQYEELRLNLMQNGYSFTIHVWRHEGHNYIVDGHQRVFTMKKMRDEEGWKIPDLPISLVEADSFQQAKLKVLAGISQYGKITEKSLFDFAQDAELKLDEIMGKFNFPELDMDKFMSMFSDIPQVPELPPPPADEDDTPEMRHSSSQVKQVLLIFNSDDYEEFMHSIDQLSSLYEKENISDTVMEVVREAYKPFAKS